MLVRPMNPLNPLSPIKHLIKIKKAVPGMLVRPMLPLQDVIPVKGKPRPIRYIKNGFIRKPNKLLIRRGGAVGSSIDPRLIRTSSPKTPYLGTKKGVLSKAQAKALYGLKKENGLTTISKDPQSEVKPSEMAKPKKGWSTKKKVIVGVVAVVTTVGIGFAIYKMAKG